MTSTLILFLVICSTFGLYETHFPQQIMDEWNPGDKASISEENWTRDLFLHKLMHGLQTSDFDWSDFSAEQTDRTIKELDKRLGTSIHPKEDYKVPRAATRKWTFKKGKVIPSMCLFKLCSFKTLKL